jgi:hypothetical protein
MVCWLQKKYSKKEKVIKPANQPFIGTPLSRRPRAYRYVSRIDTMEDYKYSLNHKCQCTQKECPILGNCVLCVQNHVEKGNHLPECMQNMVRVNIEALAGMVEFKCDDKRPQKSFWETYDKEELIKTSTERHKRKTTKP